MKSNGNNHLNNALNCLRYNEQLSKQISELISNIDRKIESLKDTQEYLMSQVKKEDQLRGSYVMQFINGQNIQLAKRPYFVSSIGLTPPTNDIQKQRMLNGSYDFYDLKRQIAKICTQKELDILKTAIGKNVFDIERERIMNSKDKTKTKDMSNLYAQKFSDLSAKCDAYMIDRIDWFSISNEHLKGRISEANCKKIWATTFNPEYVKPKWNESDCDELLRLTAQIGSQGKWVKIAEKMPMKIQPYRCFKKWLELTSRMETCDEWCAAEDAYLCDVVNKVRDCDVHNNTINWNKVGLLVSNRSVKDCERRWISLQGTILTRPFTDDEDYQLLLLIKRMGMENWGDIAREMSQRSIESCQKRYCEIVEDLHPWSYLEDRQLWLYLRPQFRELWIGNDRIEEMTSDLNLYKSIIKGFSGRCPLVIRHRYSKLCKWFDLWNRFYLCLNAKNTTDQITELQTSSLLSDDCPEKTATLGKIRNIILRTSFFDALRKALRENGSQNPDGDANELILLCKTGNSNLLNKLVNESSDQNLMEFLMFIIDLQNGTFIPRQFDRYIHRSNKVLKNPERADEDLRCLVSNVHAYEIKTAIGKTLRKRLNELACSANISQHDKKCIENLLNCEGKFIASLNFAIASLERTHDFNFLITADLLEKVLPQFLRLMVQYIYDQDHSELTKKSLTVHFNNKLASKREQIADLLIYRQAIPSIFKTYCLAKKHTCVITQNVSSDISSKLQKKDKIKINASKIHKMMSLQQHHPLLDKAIFTSRSQDVATNVIKLLTPNRCTLNLVRAFFLQKQKLLDSAEDEFCKLIRLRYDHPVNYLQSDNNLMGENSMKLDESSSDLSDPKYLLLRSRLLSLMAMPSILARISPFVCAIAADRLHEVQNNEKYSTEISRSFNQIDKRWSNYYGMAGSSMANSSLKYRKRKILECLDDDMTLMSPEKPAKLTKFNDNQPITRRMMHNWISVFLPDSKRTVFIPKDIFSSFVTTNFTIDSINGVNVKDLVD